MNNLHASKSISVDCVIFGFNQGGLEVLLIRDTENENKWRLPNDWLIKNESLDAVAKRVMNKLIGNSSNYVSQVKVFENLDKTNLNQTIIVGYFALINRGEYYMTAEGRKTDASWFKMKDTLELICDHHAIIDFSLNIIKEKTLYSSIIFNLLPEKFTLPELIRVYEAVLNRKLEKANFRKKILHMNVISAINQKQYGTSQRAASLYRFNFENSTEFKLNKEILNFNYQD
ncbi:NUDIX hydrolase [Flavobacterium circumlabens]|uniref:NUDIX hydrolase n=1 Tax=Flavobacterium circumlabens TaxID=2133765 RepID=A0A4Y7UED2_9FLAO|nr:NUDIX hydrolase [Flavobacterium circumlabens]TCN59528.1 hypothetical protein EV142_102146 [Flavobacterium circumlabens]TEB44820.1 NUDIX hydrolase [Flavobacterium circumlabens]